MLKDRHVIVRHPPVCRGYKSGNRCIYGRQLPMYRHADGAKRPSARSRKEGTQGAVAILKKKVQGCVSQNSEPKKCILRKAGQTRLNASAGHAIKFSGRTWYETKIRERKRAIWRLYPKR